MFQEPLCYSYLLNSRSAHVLPSPFPLNPFLVSTDSELVTISPNTTFDSTKTSALLTNLLLEMDATYKGECNGLSV